MKKFIVVKFGGSNLKNHHDYSRLARVVTIHASQFPGTINTASHV